MTGYGSEESREELIRGHVTRRHRADNADVGQLVNTHQSLSRDEFRLKLFVNIFISYVFKIILGPGIIIPAPLLSGRPLDGQGAVTAATTRERLGRWRSWRMAGELVMVF